MLRIAILSALLLFTASIAHAQPNPRSFENWKTDFDTTSIDLTEIMSGGPPRDGIPPIDDPKFVRLEGVGSLTGADPVLVVEIDGDARAYPLSILTWHEIVNDSFDGKPVAVTYCPLCNAAIVFSGLLDGRELDFGTTGRLRNSDLLMYDRQTESWWQQFSGEAIIGELTGAMLEMIPSTVLPFSKFAERYPDGQVLIPNNPRLRDYGRNPYAYYDSADRPFLYRGDLPDNLAPMKRVVIFDGESGTNIVTLDRIRKEGRMELDGNSLSWQAGMASALDAPRISSGRDVGFLEVTRNGEPQVHHVTFAFVAHAFHPELDIIGAGE